MLTIKNIRNDVNGNIKGKIPSNEFMPHCDLCGQELIPGDNVFVSFSEFNSQKDWSMAVYRCECETCLETYGKNCTMIQLGILDDYTITNLKIL